MTPLATTQSESAIDAAQTSSNGEKRRRPGTSWKSAWWKVVAAAAGIVACGVAVLAMLGVFAFGGDSISGTEPRPVRDVPVVEGAPEAAFVMAVTPVGEVGFVVDELFVNEREFRANNGWAVVADSGRHVSYVYTPLDLVSIYSWDEVMTDTTNTTASCVGGVGEVTNFTGCAAKSDAQIASGGTEGAGVVTLDVLAFNLPKNAAWLVVTTNSGTRITGAVVQGTAYLAWPGEGPIAAEDTMRPVQAQVLDATFAEVFQTTIG